MAKRLLSLLLAFMICVSALLSTPLSAHAAYENTYVNTGNQLADILGVALTQVGYTEGANNYTKYGEWYGYPNLAWCGMFVAWCADQADIPTSVLKKYARSNPQGYGLEELTSNNYRPKPGDLFFNKSYSHVGFVYYLDGDYFYTLEGNTGPNSDSVCIRRRLISDYTYGSPNYRGGGDSGHNYTTNHESEHPHKEYKSCTHCSDVYYTGNTTNVADCVQCKQALCDHSYGSWTKSDGTSHYKACTYCGYTKTENHSWGNDAVTSSPSCAKNGFKDQTCSVCAAARTVSIPKTDDHEFADPVYNDTESHTQECLVCGLIETQEHDGGEHWSTDKLNHWHQCTVCTDRYALSEHVFPDGCASACETCGYLNPDGHTADGDLIFDEDSHWYKCATCKNNYNYGEHSFRADCAENCDVCGYTRVTSHDFDKAWHYDTTGHWHECNMCGMLQDQTAHIPDENAKDWEDQLCIQCGYLLRSADSHVHTYDTVFTDSKTHWGQCACGQELPTQAHSWSMQTQSCTVCNAQVASDTDNSLSLHALYWCLIIFAGICILTLTIVICVKTAKKKQLTPV